MFCRSIHLLTAILLLFMVEDSGLEVLERKKVIVVMNGLSTV